MDEEKGGGYEFVKLGNLCLHNVQNSQAAHLPPVGEQANLSIEQQP